MMFDRIGERKATHGNAGDMFPMISVTAMQSFG